mgnify:CR=1 FL=1
MYSQNSPPKVLKRYLHSYSQCVNIFKGQITNLNEGIFLEIEEKLSKLKDKGVLTEEEFDTKKKELLDRI